MNELCRLLRCRCGAVLCCLLAQAAMACLALAQPSSTTKPNLVYILCDDLGYGDVHDYNLDRGKIPTPNIDAFAAASMQFTDAHSSSAVCTPSRYSLLTGRYNWRSTLQKGVLHGDDAPLLEPGRMTVGSLLQAQGYTTQAIGKWHLGLTWADGKLKGDITDGPMQHGFDHYFGIAASLDMWPFAYIDDNHFTEPLTTKKKWVREGPAAESFEAVNVLPELVKHSQTFLKAQDRSKPFFLYLALTSPHTPLVPTPQFAGKSPLGPYGDFVMETDWAIGQVLDAIKADGFDDNTLVMLASDNGCAPYIKVADLEAKGHFPSAQFRGYKADIWEGGHRIPYIVRWPGVIAAGSKAKQTVCLSDLLATTADIVGVKLPDTAGEDSVSLLPIFRGSTSPVREAEVHHSIDGNFAIRQGDWKLELCAGSGGWAAPREPAARKQGLPPIQLYNLKTDEAEQHNVASENPEVVERLKGLLTRYVEEGRSTPGATQKNDVEIDLYKVPKPGATEKAGEGG